MKKEKTKEFNIRLLALQYENGEQNDTFGDNEISMTFKDIKRLARKLSKYVNENETKLNDKDWIGDEFFLEDEVKVVDKWEWEL